MIGTMSNEKLCPMCGAYWSCDCPPPDALIYVPEPGCEHDWTEAVGVEVDVDSDSEDKHVFICRLCGIYAVSESNAGAWRR
jgi:hypothetical protein